MLTAELEARARARRSCARVGWASGADAPGSTFPAPGRRATRARRSRWTSKSTTPIWRSSRARSPRSRGTRRRALKGRARVSFQLDGKVGRPRLQLAVTGRGLAFDEHSIGDLALTVNGEGDGSLAAQLTSTAPARTRIDITTPLSVRALLRRPPTAAALARTPFDIKGTIDRAAAGGARARRGPARPRRRHAVGGRWRSRGPASAPEGKVAIDVAGATTERFPATDARIEVDFDGRAVDARARVVRKRHPLLAAEARVGAPVGGLLHPARLAAAPLRVRAVLGPLALQRLGLPPRAIASRRASSRAGCTPT